MMTIGSILSTKSGSIGLCSRSFEAGLDQAR
jgi:hypothetical protein